MDTNQAKALADTALQKGDYQSATVYYDRLLSADPTNWYNLFYSAYSAAAGCRIFQIASATKNLSTRLTDVSKAINRLPAEEKASAMEEVILRVQALCITFEKSAREQLYRCCQNLYDASYNTKASGEYLEQQWAISELLTLVGGLAETVCPGNSAVISHVLEVYRLAAQYYADFRWMGGSGIANSDQTWNNMLISKIRKHKPGYTFPQPNLQGFPDSVIYVMRQNQKKFGHLGLFSGAEPCAKQQSYTGSTTRDSRTAVVSNKPTNSESKHVLNKEKSEELAPIRKKIQPFSKMLASAIATSAYLRSNGTVVTSDPSLSVEKWTNICAVALGGWHILGLKADGTVVATGSADCGKTRVGGWEDITDICASGQHSVGLNAFGSVKAVGWNLLGQCNVSGWYGITAICASDSHTVGLKRDGTVVATGANKDGRCDVRNWKNIVAISTKSSHTVGLRSDGTVVAVGDNKHGQCDVEDWENIIAISAGDCFTMGLKSDGTVVTCGNNYSIKLFVKSWKNIAAISAGGSHAIGLQFDGTVVTAGQNKYMNGKKLFNKTEDAVQMPLWRKEGKCQYCGGTLKGLFKKQCVVCQHPKDY